MILMPISVLGGVSMSRNYLYRNGGKKNIEDLLIMLLIIGCLFARSVVPPFMIIAEYINSA